MNKIKVKVIAENKSLIPLYKTSGSAGCDLYSIVNLVVPPQESVVVSTGIKMEIPEGYEAQVRPRSGLARDNSITVLNSPGTLDSDYRGEVKIILINHGKEYFYINKGDRVAQLVFNEVVQADFDIATELSGTERGDGGFGHTGK